MLSISVLSIFDTNNWSLVGFFSLVVICFQFQFFLSLIPTENNQSWQQALLWFAFNFSSFYLWYQPENWQFICYDCCDLLSISVLSIFDTNILERVKNALKLWFAFNFSSFYLWYQQWKIWLSCFGGCDLLSISVLSIFDTNKRMM